MFISIFLLSIFPMHYATLQTALLTIMFVMKLNQMAQPDDNGSTKCRSEAAGPSAVDLEFHDSLYQDAVQQGFFFIFFFLSIFCTNFLHFSFLNIGF